MVSQIDHEYYMKKALYQAQRGYMQQEVPVGALVIDKNGNTLGQAYNRVERLRCQSAHAEIRAIEKACKKIGDWRLEDATLYVTLEPCSMCMGLVILSRLKRVVFGALSPLFGYHLDNTTLLYLYNRKVEIIGHVCEDEAAQLLQSFFRNKRKEQ